MKEDVYDLVIIGGGIMGLFTAYYAAKVSKNILLIEKLHIGNKQAASFNYTRSIRNDYLDPFYARLSYEAHGLWTSLQQQSSSQFLINCGCLNIASSAITPDLTETYAERGYQVLKRLNLPCQGFSRQSIHERFPQFQVDLAYLQSEAGLLYMPSVTTFLLQSLHERGVRILENTAIQSIIPGMPATIQTQQATYRAEKMVITTGIWTNEVLALIQGCNMRIPISLDTSTSYYFIPPPEKKAFFTPDVFPAFAYLDIGVYGHPICTDLTPGVKIGTYIPLDFPLRATTQVPDVQEFINECVPVLSDVNFFKIKDVDQCFYDIIEDDDFVLGQMPGLPTITVGCGWRGTGYKFAPLIGKALMQLSLQEGTVYNIARFSPERFSSRKPTK